MSSRQFMSSYWNDPAYLQALAERMRYQQTATMRQWETMLASPVPPVVNPANAIPVADPVDIGEPANL